MKQEIPVRIKVMAPLAGVTMMIQRGKDELLPPAKTSRELLLFEFEIVADVSRGAPNFLGPFAQGPRDARFIYVNSGTYAGQQDTGWARRAKISLMSVTREQIEQVAAKPGSRLEASMKG